MRPYIENLPSVRPNLCLRIDRLSEDVFGEKKMENEGGDEKRKCEIRARGTAMAAAAAAVFTSE